MKNHLKQIHDKVFGEEFRCFLEMAYDKGVKSGEFSECEQEYAAACIWFRENWNEEQRNLLTRIEGLQADKRDYAGEYAFCCGMSAAFEQLFLEKKEICLGFSECLDRGLFEVEGMKGHPCYYRNACELREAYNSLLGEEELVDQEDEDAAAALERDPERYHLTSHECGWDQRICSGAVYAYYFGYRLALDVIERVRPLATQRMMDQVLLTEYQLGITLPAAERERLKRKDEDKCSGKAC